MKPQGAPYHGVPDMNTLVEGAAGQVLAVGAERHAVNGLAVFGQRVDAHAAFHVPQPHRGVEGRAVWGEVSMRSQRLPPISASLNKFNHIFIGLHGGTVG